MMGATTAFRLAAAAALLTLGPCAANAAGRCDVPRALVRLAAPLPRTASRLAAHETLTVVAIGSSSTAGAGASGPSHNYPSRLAAELRQLLPGERIVVYNKGIGGETSVDMVRRFDRDVVALAPDLVIWQVGTNAVLRDTGLPTYERVVRDGVGRLRATGADVLLMDLQYAPKILARPQYPAMENHIALVGRENNVPVFRRFAVMRHWIETGQLDFPAMLSHDGLHMNDLSYACTARLLASAIVERAAPPPVVSRR